MRGDFYSREQLMAMPLSMLRGLEVQSPEQERLLQDVWDVRYADLPRQTRINRRDVPDIRDQETEAKWQEVINKRSLGDYSNTEVESTPVAQVPSAFMVSDPVSQETIPTETMGFNPLNVPLAQETGEGESITINSGVPSQVQGSVKKTARKTKSK